MLARTTMGGGVSIGDWLGKSQRCVGWIKLAGARSVSTDSFKSGGKTEVEAAAAALQAELREAAADELEAQEDLFEPLTSEEMALAKEELGPSAGPLAVLKHGRERRKRGRPKNAQNKSTADLRAFLLQHGPDPLVAAMRIIGEDELAMVALSQQVDPTKKKLSFAEARALRIRCIELVAPYVHGKQPVQVDHTIRGVVIEETIGELKQVEKYTGDGVEGVLPIVEDGDE